MNVAFSAKAPPIFSIAALFLLSLFLVAPVVAMAQDEESGSAVAEPSDRQELDYAEWLNKMGWPSLADMVLSRVKSDSGDTGVRLKVIKLQGYLTRGKFEEAKAMVAAEPNQDSQDVWALKLSMADYYYMFGKYTNAQSIYQAFFGKYPSGPPAAIKEFYIESSYKCAQMYLLMGDKKAALAAYESLLKAAPKEDKEHTGIRRQVLCDMGDLMINLMEEKPSDKSVYGPAVKKVIDELVWTPDLWFGKAIVLMAHLKFVEGDIDGAMRLVDDYKKQLDLIDDMLREEEKESGLPATRLSPMAECRYLLGVIMQNEAQKLIAANGDKDKILALLAGKKLANEKRTAGALQNFYTVFGGYPTSTWAPDAGDRAKKVEQMLRERFPSISITTSLTPEKLEMVRRIQFQTAKTLFNQRQWADAASSYVTLLNLYPEGETALSSLDDLAHCYIELKDDICAEMAIDYIAERFGQSPRLVANAGDRLLRFADGYRARQETDKEQKIYDLFFKNLRKHPKAPTIILMFGDRKLALKDYDGAIGFYKVVAGYTNSPLSLDALSKVAYCYGQTGNLTNQVKILNLCVKRADARGNPGHFVPDTMYKAAHAFKRMGGDNIETAYKQFDKLAGLLKNPKNKYQKSAEDADANDKTLQGSLYNAGVCLSMMTAEESKLKENKEKAIAYFSELVEKFPKSQLAPMALSQMSALLTVLGKAKEADDAVRKLQKDYPESAAARNAAYVKAVNLMKLGMKDQAIKAFKEMFEGSEGKYSPAQILMAGNELLKSGESEIALMAFDRVLAAGGKEKAIIEPALYGKGRALIETGKHEEGAKVLEDMTKQFSTAGATAIEVNRLLAGAYSQMAMNEPDADKRLEKFNKAVRTTMEVKKYDRTSAAKLRTSLEAARIDILKAQAEEKFGSKEKARQYKDKAAAGLHYQIMFPEETSDPAARAVFEDIYRECIPLLLEKGDFDKVVDDCNRYVETFPNGKWLNDARRWKSEANVKQTTQGAPAKQAEESGGSAATETAP